MLRKVLIDVVPNQELPPKVETPTPVAPFLSPERRSQNKATLGEDSFTLRNSRPSTKGRFYIILSVIILIVVVVLTLLTYLGTATVTIYPIKQSIETNQNLLANDNPSGGELGFSVLEITETKSTNIPSTSTRYVERKANGKITVYNNYSKEPISLIANTRFLTDAGLIYRISSAIKIPGQHLVNGKLEPGTLEVEVTADKPGVEYNIEPTTFKIPGLESGPMKGLVYAISTGKMSGAFMGEIATVSDKDLSVAKTKLQSELLASMLAKLDKSVPENAIFFRDAYSVSFEFNEYAQVDDTSPNTNRQISMNGSLQAFLLDKKELSSALAKRDLSGVADENILIEDWSDVVVDITSDIGTPGTLPKLLELKVSGRVTYIWQTDIRSLQEDLAGVARDEYANIFLDYAGVDRAEVKFTPFWKRSFPNNPSRVSVVVNTGTTQ